MMGDYRKYVTDLSPLESFDPAAFHPDERCSRQLCEFMLGLALIYNDFRDVIICFASLDSTRPTNTQTLTPELGQFGGVCAHLVRLQAGILHELAVFLEKNEPVLSDPWFMKLTKQLHPEARAGWQKIVASLESEPGGDPVSRLIFFARNKVGYHYDRKEIRKGFEQAFTSGDQVPLISRGESMAETRFYFADAAADSYFRSLGPADLTDKFGSGATPILTELNHALRELVVKFIYARGVGFRKFRSAPAT